MVPGTEVNKLILAQAPRSGAETVPGMVSLRIPNSPALGEGTLEAALTVREQPPCFGVFLVGLGAGAGS